MPPFLPPCHAALLDRGASLLLLCPPSTACRPAPRFRLPYTLQLCLSPRPISRQCRQGRAAAHGSRQSAVVRTPGRLRAVLGPRALPGSSRQVRYSRMPRSRQGPSLCGQKGRDGRGRKIPARFGQNRGVNAASDPRIAATSFGPALGRAQGALPTRQCGPRAASRGCVACARVSRLSSASRPLLQGAMGSRAGCGARPAQARAGIAPQGLRAPAPGRDPGDPKC